MKSKYYERLSKGFPKELHSDLKKVLKILPIENNKLDNLIHENNTKLVLNNEILFIPYRIYFNEPKPEFENLLTENQKDILNCIYLRHHNGYLREKRLKLLSENSDKWSTPYIFQLIGEYIYELLPIIDKKINDKNLNYYIKLKNDNPRYWQQTKSRMISYWNVYYRDKYPKLEEYLGVKIINRIKKH